MKHLFRYGTGKIDGSTLMGAILLIALTALMIGQIHADPPVITEIALTGPSEVKITAILTSFETTHLERTTDLTSGFWDTIVTQTSALPLDSQPIIMRTFYDYDADGSQYFYRVIQTVSGMIIIP